MKSNIFTKAILLVLLCSTIAGCGLYDLPVKRLSRNRIKGELIGYFLNYDKDKHHLVNGIKPITLEESTVYTYDDPGLNSVREIFTVEGKIVSRLVSPKTDLDLYFLHDISNSRYLARYGISGDKIFDVPIPKEITTIIGNNYKRLYYEDDLVFCQTDDKKAVYVYQNGGFANKITFKKPMHFLPRIFMAYDGENLHRFSQTRELKEIQVISLGQVGDLSKTILDTQPYASFEEMPKAISICDGKSVFYFDYDDNDNLFLALKRDIKVLGKSADYRAFPTDKGIYTIEPRIRVSDLFPKPNPKCNYKCYFNLLVPELKDYVPVVTLDSIRHEMTAYPNLFQKKSGRYTKLSILSDFSNQHLLLYNIWPIKDEIISVARCYVDGMQYIHLFCMNGVYLVKFSSFRIEKDKPEFIDMLPRNIP
ncbi:MAG TPA: hypothetical protein PLX04_02610 [Caldisericia bacterium]|nr:hypothetical protein [Caldisericia bacterium]HOR47256.1 hypothetical protein [Caldisericia bacterium]HOU08170.1 hypothetical protein [Caldisericia bacterium]HPL89141.1 hypothetical protein [Caldisericia bacterium]HQG59830.1 hypothetical protein [Caldisericia bacterium]